VILGFLAAGLGFAFYRATSPAITPPLPAMASTPSPETSATPRSTTTTAGPLQRQPARRPSTPPPEPAPRPSFAEFVDELARAGQATADLLEAERITEAEASDERTRARFAVLMATFPDAAEQALAVLGTIPPDSDAAIDLGRRMVLQHVLDTDCTARHRAAEAADDYSRLDPVIGSLLTVMHYGGETATLGGQLLIDRPFLRLSHEAAVLEIVELAGEDRFPRTIATGLLTTLWHNLQANGERSSEDLTSLAVILMSDPDVSRRTAACRHLLLDDRYRPMLLAWLREKDDIAVTAEVTRAASRELPPRQAIRVLRELGAVLPNMPGAYMALAARSTEVVLAEYYTLLGNDTHAEVRRDLISGLGMAPGTEARKVIELALGDPAGQVRAQAVLTLSAVAPEEAEAACNTLLDDARTATDPLALGIVVIALQNLEAAGLIHAIDRLGQRLQRAPLSPASKQRLEEILARALPGGRTSRG